MSLANAAALAWLLLAVPVVVFYVLKIRLRRVPVSTVLFWHKIFDEKKPRSLWQRLRHRRYELHLVQTYDRYEREPPDMLGDVEMWDVESGAARKVTVTEKNLRQYRQLFDRFQDKVQGYCNRFSLGCTRTSTDIPFDELVLRMMRQAGSLR